MLACANCWQALVFDVMDLQADSITHAKTPMYQLVQADCKGLLNLPARAYSSLRGFLPTACKGLSAITLLTPAASCADMLLWPL